MGDVIGLINKLPATALWVAVLAAIVMVVMGVAMLPQHHQPAHLPAPTSPAIVVRPIP